MSARGLGVGFSLKWERWDAMWQVTRCRCCLFPCTMEEPIYEEMNPVETDGVADMEQPIYKEMKLVAPEGSEPVRGFHIEEEEWEGCVKNLIEDVWDGFVDFTLLASRVSEKINPDCFYCCGVIKLAHKLRDGEFGANLGLLKVTLIEIEGKDLCEFLQGKLMDRTEKQNQCREGEDEKQEKTE